MSVVRCLRFRSRDVGEEEVVLSGLERSSRQNWEMMSTALGVLRGGGWGMLREVEEGGRGWERR
jgi:hypothetical protein